MPQLRFKSGAESGRAFDLEGESIKIGRDPACEVELKESGVSREHAEVYRVGQMFFIRDLDSRNGVMVNDVAVEDELLRDGDTIRICSQVMVFEGSVGTADGHGDSFYSEADHDPGETMVMNFDVELQGLDAESSRLRQITLKMSQSIAEAKRVESILGDAMELIFDAVDVSEVFIFILEPGHRLAQKAHRHIGEDQRGKASRSIVLRALKEKRCIITANAMDDFRFQAESSIALKNIGSVLCCPMISLGHEVGVIYLNQAANSKPFTHESAELIQQLAFQLAPAIEVLNLRKSESSITDKSVRLLAETIERSVPALKGRAQRVGTMSNLLGKAAGLKRSQLLSLHIAAHVHHMGFMELSRRQEMGFEFLKTDLSHVTKSLEILGEDLVFADARAIVEAHRYRLDGQGHPKNLNVGQWSVESQILSVCVDLDARLNLPLSFGLEPESLAEVKEFYRKEGTEYITRPVVTLLEQTWDKGLLT